MTPSPTLRHLLGCRMFAIEEQLKQANHLVNPSSGIANDFLNQYNEILLLVENLPILLPEMIEELLAWSPRSYEEYFRISPLVGGHLAIEIYQALDEAFREDFEAQIAKVNVLASKAILVISHQLHGSKEMHPEDIVILRRNLNENESGDRESRRSREPRAGTAPGDFAGNGRPIDARLK